MEELFQMIMDEQELNEQKKRYQKVIKIISTAKNSENTEVTYSVNGMVYKVMIFRNDGEGYREYGQPNPLMKDKIFRDVFFSEVNRKRMEILKK